MSIQKFETDPVWTPSEISGRRMKGFMKIVERNRKLKFDNYMEFHKWSVDHVRDLWEELWHYAGIISSKTYDKVIDLSVPMQERPKWFEGARLNFGENMLKFRDDHVALLLAGEDREVERVTYKQLYEESRLYAAAFRKMGLKKGDVVTCYMSNRKEPVIAMIAATSIGAIWTGGLPLIGPQAYISRVKQVKPKVLLTVDQFSNNKEIKHLLQNTKEIVDGLPSIEKVIIVPSKPDSKLKDISDIKNSVFLDDFLRTGYNDDGTVPEIIFEQVSFSHPVFINYTSGTTGLPKTLVHGFGALLPCVRDYWLHLDTDRNDVWFSMSPVGWVSWNMVNHLLFNGVTLTLFEGVPYFLSPTYFWDMVENLKVSKAFVTPKTLDEMEAKGFIPTEKHDLISFKTILCGSSVVKPRNFEFALKKIKPGLTFSVGCGSTETMGFYLLTEHTLPLYKGEISSSCLGIGIECLDEGGKSLIGEMGEFAISTPMPCHPLFIWGDYDGIKYKDAYFSKYTGKFTIGDSAIINPFTKGIIICGRSDETLKPKGCRFGSSEIYNIVELFPDIRDSLCVAQYNADKDERAVLFVKMRKDYSFTRELEMNLREKIARELTVNHVPEIMLEVPDIPYNVNGKKMEIIVKKIINKTPHNTEMSNNIIHASANILTQTLKIVSGITVRVDNNLIMDLQRFNKLPEWIPKEKSGARMKLFMKRIQDNYSVKFANYFEFHKWSVEHISEFWAEMWYFMGIVYSKTYDKVIDLTIPMENCPIWFEGAKLNFAENLLKFRDDRVAIISTGEDKTVKQLTFRQLYEEAKLYAAAFRKIGLKKGDRVACYMSNRKEAVLAMISVTSIGAIWTGALPLLGPQAYMNRVSQVDPTVLITIDQFPHNKEVIHLLKNIKEISEGIPSLKNVIIVPSQPESKLKDISDIPNSCFLDDFLRDGRNPDGSVPDLKFEQLPFSHPVFISYTSGTTGLPKTIVHGFGALLPGTRDFWLHWNSRREDVWLSMSPVGWVSWNMVNNVLFVGETMVLFEGVPYFLSPTFFWDLVDELKLSRVFMTPSVMDELESREYLPTAKHHLSSLEMVMCAGSVVKPHNFDFALKKIKKDVMFAIGYGATEIMGFCLVSEKSLPVYRGEISAPSLGVAVDCLDEAGNPVHGEMGEFIISKPMPSLPLGLWGDNYKRDLLKKSYFSKFPGVFTIGDTIIINPVTKGIICCGRSDETLKPRGCRFGSSEIYNIVEHIPDIRDSLCVSQFSKDMDERAVLFVKMHEGYPFNEGLVHRLRAKISEELSSRHVPEVILEVPEIPHNVNGKKMEIIVKKIINNMSYNAEMVSNANCLKYYYNIPELQGF